ARHLPRPGRTRRRGGEPRRDPRPRVGQRRVPVEPHRRQLRGAPAPAVRTRSEQADLLPHRLARGLPLHARRRGATVSSFLRALRGENTPVAPIWIMRQAGRHLPEYRALKEKHAFWELARTPELAAEVTLQPIRRYGLDAAILFSDIMTPLPAMGLELDFRPGPVLTAPVRSRAAVDALRVPAAEEIAPFVADAIRLIRSETEAPLIGFGGAPLTLATYAVQGAGSKDYDVFRAFLKAEPEAAHALLDKLTAVSVRYLSEQVRAGAQAIQLFDSWAGLHDEATYRTFGLPYAARVLEALEPFGVPRIYIAVGASHLYSTFAELPIEALSVD